jgi:hypothetical protein
MTWTRCHRPRALPALAGVLAVLLAGCGGGAGDAARVAGGEATSKPRTALDVEADRVAATASYPGAAEPAVLAGDAPTEKQLPAGVKDALRGTIEPWLIAWRVSLGTFRATELARTGEAPLPEDDVTPFDGNADGADLRLLYLVIPSPGGGVLLDPHLEWTLTGEAGHAVAARFGQPGAELIDLATRIRRHVLDARGPGGRVDGAAWLDDTRFVVFAAERFEANPWRGGPVLYLVDLGRGVVTRYAGPATDYDGFRAVGGGFDRRFRATLPDVAFDGRIARN